MAVTRRPLHTRRQPRAGRQGGQGEFSSWPRGRGWSAMARPHKRPPHVELARRQSTTTPLRSADCSLPLFNGPLPPAARWLPALLLLLLLLLTPGHPATHRPLLGTVRSFQMVTSATAQLLSNMAMGALWSCSTAGTAGAAAAQRHATGGRQHAFWRGGHEWWWVGAAPYGRWRHRQRDGGQASGHGWVMPLHFVLWLLP